jgi:hypothetical protein
MVVNGGGDGARARLLEYVASLKRQLTALTTGDH